MAALQQVDAAEQFGMGSVRRKGRKKAVCNEQGPLRVLCLPLGVGPALGLLCEQQEAGRRDRR